MEAISFFSNENKSQIFPKENYTALANIFWAESFGVKNILRGFLIKEFSNSGVF